jgi:cell division protein FtsN
MPKSSLLSRPAVRKLLLAYVVAVILVLAYFVVRTLFQEQREMEFMEFNTCTKAATAQESSSEPAIAEKKFMLLPK